jgi:hypothetical protein
MVSQFGKYRPGRSVAQPGSASAWGAEGREFESHRSDHSSNSPLNSGRFGGLFLPRCAVGAPRAVAPRHRLRKASRPRQVGRGQASHAHWSVATCYGMKPDSA